MNQTLHNILIAGALGGFAMGLFVLLIATAIDPMHAFSTNFSHTFQYSVRSITLGLFLSAGTVLLIQTALVLTSKCLNKIRTNKHQAKEQGATQKDTYIFIMAISGGVLSAAATCFMALDHNPQGIYSQHFSALGPLLAINFGVGAGISTIAFLIALCAARMIKQLVAK